ncbi:MAG TPA: hypothetical protein VEA15_03100 [Caulobacteraceae bacterium]|nr:hypothetical protein [Caulobacteraceae bacterium]
MGPEVILGIVGSLIALVIAVRALQDAKAWERFDKQQEREREQAEKRPSGDPDRPWGG